MNTLLDTWVPVDALEELGERFAKLVKRSQRLGMPVPVLTRGERVIGSSEGHSVTPTPHLPPVEWINVIITGESIRLGDYRLVASIDPLEMKDGQVKAFFRAVPGEVVPESWRETDPSYCSHCNLSRRRTETFLVTDGGKWMQLGRQCIRDFLGHDVAGVVGWLRFFGELRDFTERGDWGPYVKPVYFPEDIIKLAARVVAHDGFYVSRAKADAAPEGEHIDSTAQIVRILIWPPRNEAERAFNAQYHDPINDERADAIFNATMEALPDLKLESDWSYSIRDVSQAKVISARQIGVAASAVILGLRKLEEGVERKVAATRKVSEYQGNVGDKLTITVKVLSEVLIDGDYGTVALYIMLDEESGAVYKSFVSGATHLTPDETYTIKGTVKRHEEYKGQRNTLITRIRVA